MNYILYILLFLFVLGCNTENQLNKKMLYSCSQLYFSKDGILCIKQPEYEAGGRSFLQFYDKDLKLVQEIMISELYTSYNIKYLNDTDKVIKIDYCSIDPTFKQFTKEISNQSKNYMKKYSSIGSFKINYNEKCFISSELDEELFFDNFKIDDRVQVTFIKKDSIILSVKLQELNFNNNQFTISRTKEINDDKSNKYNEKHIKRMVPVKSSIIDNYINELFIVISNKWKTH